MSWVEKPLNKNLIFHEACCATASFMMGDGAFFFMGKIVENRCFGGKGAFNFAFRNTAKNTRLIERFRCPKQFYSRSADEVPAQRFLIAKCTAENTDNGHVLTPYYSHMVYENAIHPAEDDTPSATGRLFHHHLCAFFMNGP
jgi:hypothetical protein